jgi:hypothetical protein
MIIGQSYEQCLNIVRMVIDDHSIINPFTHSGILIMVDIKATASDPVRPFCGSKGCQKSLQRDNFLLYVLFMIHLENKNHLPYLR